MNEAFDKFLGEAQIQGRTRRILSLLLLGFAAAIALIGRFEGQTWYFTTKTYTIAPTFLSGIIGFALLFPLYLRRILKFEFSLYGVLSFLAMALIFSSFIEIAIGEGFAQGTKTILIGAAVLLSWLGMRGVAGLAWILVIIAVFLTMQSTSNAMGLWGWAFLASSILGLLLHAHMGPREFILSLQSEYGKYAMIESEKPSSDHRQIEEHDPSKE